MLTKKLKKNWVEALESGKYIRGIGQLYNTETNKYCCLGVLAKISPDLELDSEGYDCNVNGERNGYSPLVQLLTEPTMLELYKLNDMIAEELDPTYSNVLPHIKELPTVD